MLKRLRKWFSKDKKDDLYYRSPIAWVPKSKMPVAPLSHHSPLDPISHWNEYHDFLMPPELDPRIIFPLFRRLRDFVPDVSAGVWAWVRLCSTAQSYSFPEGSEADIQYAQSRLKELDRRIYGLKTERAWGVEALVNCFFLSVFTYGSFCGEVVLDSKRQRIERFIIIDPATVRFKLNHEDRSFLPYQILSDGHLISLNPSSFFYYGLDTDGLTPYGRSPLLAVPLVAKIQQSLLHDMASAQHNAGYPTIHVKMKKPEQIKGESMKDYYKRLNDEVNSMRSELNSKEADSNVITFDNVEVFYIGPNGRSFRWTESIQAISEQVISALHLAPFMLGRNWGTTESWGMAQYQLLMNNARSVQAGARRLAEWLYNLELILSGLPLTVRYNFEPHHRWDLENQSRSFKTTVEALLELMEYEVLDKRAVQRKVESMVQRL